MTEMRYEINSLIGKGRTGGVYTADDTKLDRKVALRRFFDPANRVDFTHYKDEFLEVGNSLCGVQHTNLVRVLDAGFDEDGAYIVSEFLEGVSLRDEIKKGLMEVHEVVELARQMLDALSLVHSLGEYHGSLTSRSILMTPRARGGYRYVILDMGLAKLASFMEGEDARLKLLADFALLAPELFDGAESNAQADIYMLGQVVYLCLAGGHPYGGLAAEEAKERHLQGLPSIQNYNVNVPKELEDWIMKVAAVRPEDRFGSAVEALEALPDIPHRPVIMPAPIKKSEVVPTKLKVNSVKSKAVAPTSVAGINKATAPVPITAPNGVNSITASVPIYAPGAGSKQPVNTAVEQVKEQQVSDASVFIQPEKKNSMIGLYMGLCGLVAVVAVATYFMLFTKESNPIDDLTIVESSSIDDHTVDSSEESSEVVKKKSRRKNKVIAYLNGDPKHLKKWKQLKPSGQNKHKHNSSLVVRDSDEELLSALKFPLQKHGKKMFEQGWRMTYKVRPTRGSHRLGFTFKEESNPGWEGGRICCCIILKVEKNDLVFNIPQNNGDTRVHRISYGPKIRPFIDLTIEQSSKSVSGDYVVKVNGNKVFTEMYLENTKYNGVDQFKDHLFVSSLNIKGSQVWTIQEFKLELL